MNAFVTVPTLRRWSDRIDAPALFPGLLRRLVIATVPPSTTIDFPAQESVRRSGFDGAVVCDAGNAWVPGGRSVWELGVSASQKAKADDDFDKRTERTPPDERAASTFVFVTPRHWEKKRQWAAERNAEGAWKLVRAYDADDLIQWLETADAVAAWFGREIGSRPGGIDDVAARWEALSAASTLPLSPSVLLAGRALGAATAERRTPAFHKAAATRRQETRQA